jgi:squalene-hopene/tetraprenyl-beta-curcumene cyclase
MTMRIDENSLEATIEALRQKLLAARGPQGSWEGRLSGSALSTATAVFALAPVDAERHRSLIHGGLNWLADHQNADGGWGDTVQSPSNLSTTLLCYSALATDHESQAARKAESWLQNRIGSLYPQALAQAVEQQYGRDRTFAVPILTMAALAERLGTSDQSWRLVKPLPFELAVLPHRLYKWLRLPVVSYALPALIAIGQARYEHLKPRNPITGLLRRLSREKTLRVLTDLQPANGGFLEAPPLTSFVVMSLAASGREDHEVVRKGIEFLTASVREDGSWPIDTNLAGWVTTLSISALFDCGLQIADCGLRDWLLSCQHRDVHPYTQAAPGGWAWSNLPGAVPDGDDTAGALIALHKLSPESTIAATAGIDWLLGLQNRDGGIPTFCRGWTKLPFDRSTPDITAHAIAAMAAWLPSLPEPLRTRTDKATSKALQYMRNAQRPDGAWTPLWFGNQSAPNHENPVYGTSRALTHLSASGTPIHEMCERAVRWLLTAQNTDGGWGGDRSVPSSIEETALAVDALATVALQSAIPDPQSAIDSGVRWLIEHTDRGRSTPASPIGLYFARLWYFEELYPIVFALSALGKVRRLCAGL